MADSAAVLVETPYGPARVTRSEPDGPVAGRLVLGHGAGGLRWTDDLTAVRDAAVELGWLVDLVDQPWRVAGRKVGPRPAALDVAWLAAVRSGPSVPGPVVVAGRSAGARVACRTAQEAAASAVLAVSFPLHPPGRPDRSRAEELARPSAVGIPVHVVQGRADPFGTPDEVRAVLPQGAAVTGVDGAHSLERVAPTVAASAARALALVGEE